MPELTAAPDAERPIGRFITDYVLPQWDSLNEYSYVYRHNRVVTRAMRRQGLQVRELGGLDAAIMHDGRIVGGRLGRETTLVSDQAAEACSVKSLTRAYWAAADLPTPTAERFSSGEAAAAEEYVGSAAKPLVLKPDSARHGSGVSFGASAADFKAAWKKAAERNQVAGIGEGILIEEFIDALCLRFFVVGGQVRGVTLRVPLFVTGDGSSTVRALLERSFEHQRRNALLRITRPKITAELVRASGWQLDDVPEAGSVHILSENVSLMAGGLPYDVTMRVSEDLNHLATEAALAVPGLAAVGIDILTPSLGSAEEAVVLDADTWATLLMHGYPAFGARRLIGRPIANQLRLRADYWERPAYSAAAPAASSPEDE